MSRIIGIFLDLLPLTVLTLVLVVLSIIRNQAGYIPPLWFALVVFVIAIIEGYGYIIKLNMQKRIGGWLLTFFGVIILIGMLIPADWVGEGPTEISRKIDAAFLPALHSSLEEPSVLRNQDDETINFIVSLGSLDYFSYGQIALFGLLGISMGICFLFGTRFKTRKDYILCFIALILSASWFALFCETIQVFAPSRIVAWRGLLESLTGAFGGLLLIAVIWVLHESYIKRHPKTSSRFNVLGVGVDALDMDGCINRFEEIINGNSGYVAKMTSALGAAGIVEARRYPKMQEILNNSVLNTADGMPLVWLGKLYGYDFERVYGPDLLRDVCAYSADKCWKHFFYGGAPGIVEKLQEKLEEKHPNIQISGIHCPPFRALTQAEENELIETVNRRKPDIFWIGISTPKQLYFMDHMKDKLACKIICPVGYAFDVNAGVEFDAPDWVKYSGFQWLHRVLKQPRLIKRYLPDNPRFIFETILQLMHLKKYPMFKGTTDRVNILGTGINIVNMSSATDYIFEKKKGYVCVTGAHGVLESIKDYNLKLIHNNSLLTVPDGMPNVWLGKLNGYKAIGRVYGPDLMLNVCKRSLKNGESHFLFGATEKTNTKVKKNLETKFPSIKIVGTYAPPFRALTQEEEIELKTIVAECSPDFLWVGLSTPKQEKFMSQHSVNGEYPLDAKVMFGVGAAFDFHAGNIKDAPKWIKNIGMQWFYRLCSEPKRLWKRYGFIVPCFILLNLLQLFKIKKYRLD